MTTFVGAEISRIDGPLKVTGRAKYSAEFAPEGLCYAAVIESTIPAGKVVEIDVASAERADGVVLVLTHFNAPKLPYHKPKERPVVDPVSGEQLKVLQNADVVFFGQPIGVVVAKTQSQAQYAASLVRVKYRRDPHPKTTFDASRSKPTSKEAAKKGRGPESKQGDPDNAFLEAAVRVDQVYKQPREHHNAMEPHATIAHWEVDRLTIWDKTQWVDNVRDEVGRTFGISPQQIRVINPFIGGAFGSALRVWPHVALAVMASKQTKQPVRLELTRRQLFQSTGFRPYAEQRVALGASRDGTLGALIQEAVAQTSTYEEFADATLDAPAVTYRCANRRTSYRLVEMNTNTPCPMRGPGHVTGLFAQEIAMDELAVELGIDPIDLRLLNYADRDPKKDIPWSTKSLRECYRLGAERIGWARRNHSPRSMRVGNALVGWGMATALNPANRYPTDASVSYSLDGYALVRCATSDMGPGTYTLMAQIAADTLRLPLENIRVELGDSSFPKAKEHGGSTTTVSVGSAVQDVCSVLVTKMNDLAALLHVEAQDWHGILQRAGIDHLDAETSVSPNKEAKAYSTYSFGAVFAEVSVDEDLGTVRVPRIIGVYDAGRIVNPKLARSQCIGAMVGGIGMALLEQAEWDARFGKVTNASLAEYLVPVNADIIELDVSFVTSQDDVLSPVGSKGLAELGLCGVAPAIVNAVWHATGKRIRDLPITLEKLLMT